MEKLRIDLPDKMSELIRFALEDLKKAVDDGVIIDMGSWHYKDQLGVCHVCLAGAVMRRALDDDEVYASHHFAPETDCVFDALDELRRGHVTDAYECLTNDLSPTLLFDMDRYISPYSNKNPAPFYNDMEKLADDLEAAGY